MTSLFWKDRLFRTTHSMGYDWLFSLMGYTGPWKERRRMFQQYLSNKNANVYRDRLIKFVRRALTNLLDRPQDFNDIIQ